LGDSPFGIPLDTGYLLYPYGFGDPFTRDARLVIGKPYYDPEARMLITLTALNSTSTTFNVALNQPPPLACDTNHDGATNVNDVQVAANQAIGAQSCTADINQDGVCNVIDVQRVVNAALGGTCVSP